MFYMCYATQIHSDPLVKVFDMRMLRQRAPLSLAIPPPNNVKLLPHPPRSKYQHQQSAFSLMASSPNGCLQTIDLDANYEPIMPTLQMLYATLTDPQETGLSDSLSVVAASSTGHFLASGSSMGVVSLHSRADSAREDVVLSVNEVLLLTWLCCVCVSAAAVVMTIRGRPQNHYLLHLRDHHDPLYRLLSTRLTSRQQCY